MDDWADGSKGWIIWISLASLFADATAKFLWFLCVPLWRRSGLVALLTDSCNIRRKRKSKVRQDGHDPRIHISDSRVSNAESELLQPLLREISTDFLERRKHVKQDAREHNGRYYNTRTHLLAFLISIIICVNFVHLVFKGIMLWYLTILAIALSIPVATIGIRCIAETDYHPESALGICLHLIKCHLIGLTIS